MKMYETFPSHDSSIISQILDWKEKRKALILAHNYQIPEIQDIADFVGDSLELSRKASESESKLIIFCGVHFMAESAAIFSPEKKILIPDLRAGCSLAESISVQELKKWKKQYPDAVVVSYINTSVAVKAESDYCCTSSNAVKIVNSIPSDREILFVPDIFLGDFVTKVTGRKNIITFPGQCHIHSRVRPEDILQKTKEYPNAEFLIHPECGCVSECMNTDIKEYGTRNHILSTGQMMKYASSSQTKEFIIATEIGILHRLRKENPGKTFIPVRNDMVCPFMKKITLEKLLNSLRNLEFEVKVSQELARKARIPIKRMLEVTN
ncbi:MAG: Quinolinate synthase A [Candidatus Gottesmanbacteria bacterium GW2011_GWC2_39_8]|uniref:Quinolinate synthase n=1 Tax=Candidatus Gottesmanbacteria bacterium GW2011_GWC2_39_8 TaxID=1618450 RepID=A0A0G0PYH7_9BACT|nr:MAG: Quinolinate synthase A [Candidatus Gottesmanbacteria bacterium GW2011_GWC2_39_8]